MMLAHGITSVGMFFLVGVIYDRAHTRDLNKLGGLANIMPLYGAMSYIIFFGSMGLPGLCGFVAEVFVVLSAFNYSPILAVLAAAAVILTAGYILWTIQRVFLGRSEAWKGLPDMNSREIAIAVPLVVLTIAMGIFPQWLVLSWMSPSVDQMVQSVNGPRDQRSIESGQVSKSSAANRCATCCAGTLVAFARIREPAMTSTLVVRSCDGCRWAMPFSLEKMICCPCVKLPWRCTLRPTSEYPLIGSQSESKARLRSGRVLVRRSRTTMRARSWMAALALVVGTSIAVGTRDAGTRDRARLPRRVKPRKPRRKIPHLRPIPSSLARVPTVQLNLKIAGLGAEGCDVEIKPGNASCKFRPLYDQRAQDRQHVSSDGTANLELRDVELRGADRTCTIAIIIREPGQATRTFYRGFRLTSKPEAGTTSKTAAVPTFTCFLSSPSKLAKADESRARK